MPFLCMTTQDMNVDLLRELTKKSCKAGKEEIQNDHKKSLQITKDIDSVQKSSMVCFENGFGPERKHGHFTGVRRNVIPYPDHNYGQPPPMTPPGPCSPDPNEQTDTGNEEEDEEGVTRCICGFSHDDGYMICCDKCSSWQHIDCMGILSNAVPEKYLCDKCQPRTLDVDRAKAIQKKKREEKSDDDDSDTDDESVASYTAVSSTPTRITLTANASSSKKKPKWRLPVNRLSLNPTQIQKTSATSTAPPKLTKKKKKKFENGLTDDILAFWDTHCLDKYHEAMTNFEPISKCRYESGLDVVLWQAPEGTENEFDFAATDNVCVVSKASELRKGLFAARDIEKGSAIIELKGIVSLTPNFKGHSPARYCPYSLYYNELDHMEFMIDSRKSGNDARYVRRSCSWNALVKHQVVDGSLRFFVCANKFIPLGAEIVISFEHPIPAYTTFLECACGLAENCPVTKHNVKFQAANQHNKVKVKELVQAFTQVHLETRNPRNPGSDSDDAHDVDVGSNEKQSAGRRKQLSREDRKLQAYLKQIEKMEKKEHKPKDIKSTPQRPSVEEAQTPTTPLAIPKDKMMMPKKCGGRRKMSMTKGKRPRLSSCSSEPLSPDVDVMSTQATTPVLSLSSGCIDLPSKSKSLKRDKCSITNGFNIDKHRTAPLAKRLKQESLEQLTATSTGSPTPPSTPGQLSPTARVLSIQTDLLVTRNDMHSAVSPFANSILSHTSPLSAVDGRKASISGLLQLAEQSDSSCGSLNNSPLPLRKISTSGCSTSEEKIGDCGRNEMDPSIAKEFIQPSCSLLSAKLSKQRPYYGSLKKKWLHKMYYNTCAIGQDNDIDKSPAISLSALMSNSLLYAKKMFSQPSSVINGSLSRLPLKKRRLKAAVADMMEPESDSNDYPSTSSGRLDKYKPDRPRLSLSSFLLSSSASSRQQAKQAATRERSEFSVSFEEDEKRDETSQDTPAFSSISTETAASVSSSVTAELTESKDLPESTLTISEPGDSQVKSLSSETEVVSSALSVISSPSVNSYAIPSADDTNDNIESSPIDIVSNDVVTSVTVEQSTYQCTPSSSQLESQAIPTMSNESDLTSSGYSISTTPLEGHRENVERRDSVSSTSSERSDIPGMVNTSGGKKKMSLSEYRNRQRTKPIPSTPSPTVTPLSKSTGQPFSNEQVASLSSLTQTPTSSFDHNNTWSAQADSLLTPRTLSLSSSFSSGQQSKVTSLSSAAASSSLAESSSVSSSPMFEPVSPTNDDDHFVSTTQTHGQATPSSVFNYGSMPSHNVASLQGTVYMRGQPFSYSTVGSTTHPASTIGLHASSMSYTSAEPLYHDHVSHHQHGPRSSLSAASTVQINTHQAANPYMGNHYRHEQSPNSLRLPLPPNDADISCGPASRGPNHMPQSYHM